MINTLALILLLFIALVIGYCGATDHGFHKLGAYFGIIDIEKTAKKSK